MNLKIIWNLWWRISSIFKKKENNFKLTKDIFEIFRTLLISASASSSPAWKTVYEVWSSILSAKDSRKLWFDKNLKKWMRNIIFHPILRLFMDIKIIEKTVDWKKKNNISQITSDFQPYIQHTNNFKKTFKIFKIVVAVSLTLLVTWMLSIIYFFVVKSDLPWILNMKEKFSSYYEILSNTSWYIIAAILFLWMVYFAINKMIQLKMFNYLKLMDAYLVNLFLYHYIMNHYGWKWLGYFHFKSVLKYILETLAESEEVLSSDEKNDYYIYLNNISTWSSYIKNQEIWWMFRSYYDLYKKGMNSWFQIIEWDLYALYTGRASSLEEKIKGELEKTQTVLKWASMLAIWFVLISVIALVGSLVFLLSWGIWTTSWF